MADSEGKAIKNELLTRAGDNNTEIVPMDEDEPPRELPDIARVGAGRFAKTNPSEVIKIKTFFLKISFFYG